MPRGIQLCVCLENKPGQLARLTAALRRAKVNIEAISVVDTADCGLVRLVTSSNAAAKAALAKAGMCVTQSPVVTLRLRNEPGALAGIAQKLAAAKVNVDYVYGSAAATGAASRVVLGVSDVAKALKAIG